MTPGQSRAYLTLRSRYELSIDQGIINFSKDCVLEIGFGMGQSLLKMSLENPHLQYIGIEVHRPGVGALLSNIEKHQVQNIVIYNEDAINVLNQCIRDDSLSKIQIFFPDPWPKLRHRKRRLIQPEFIALVYRKLKRGGFLYLATDWPDYADQMNEVVLQKPGFVVGEKIIRPVTKFEQKALQSGGTIYDLVFIKKP